MKKFLWLALISISFISCSSLPDSGNQEQITQNRAVALQLMEQANGQYDKAIYDGALQTYRIALHNYAGINNSHGMISALLAIARTNMALAQYDEARNNLAFAQEMSVNEGQPFHLRSVYNHLADLELVLGNYQAALEYCEADGFFPVEEIHEVNSKRLRIMGSVAKKQQDYDTALMHFQEALAMDLKLNDYADIASDYYLIASIFSLQGDYASALQNLELALERDEYIEFAPGIASDLTAMGRVHIKEGNHEEARYFLTKAYLAWNGLSRQNEMDQVAQLIEELTGEEFISP